MGSQCLNTTPAERYSKYLASEPLLKHRWAPIRLFKLKKMFQAHASTNNTLQYQSFISLFPEFEHRNF